MANVQQEIQQRIAARCREWGQRLLILGHHYQDDAVLAHANLCGDSFQLSAKAATVKECEAIIFCGVHFMAETADILVNSRANLDARNGKRIGVFLPDSRAGCPMADMATAAQVESCWQQLSEVCDLRDVIPVTYVNSSAEVKAFCGRHNGFVCTSSNTRRVLETIFSDSHDSDSHSSRRVLFLPDQHLGRNTAAKMGFADEEMPDKEMILWQRDFPFGGRTRDELAHAKIILWDGFCCVHQNFTFAQIDALRKAHPQVRIIVHPECTHAVVNAADDAGSTSEIIAAVQAAPNGTCWGIGTEAHLVKRLQLLFPNQQIFHLADQPQRCETMERITPQALLETLEELNDNFATRGENPSRRVRVEESIAADAFLALERMLAVK